MASIFTRIIAGEIPCYKVAENDHCIAFLDINPLKEGHTLVIPKKEVDYIFDNDNETLSEILPFSKKIAIAIKKAIPCSRVGIMVAGLEVPHTHIHLVPMNSVGDLNFSKAQGMNQKDLADVAKKIKAAF